MTDPGVPGTTPDSQPTPPIPEGSGNRQALYEHFLAYGNRFRRDTLSRAAIDAGHDASDVEAAWRRVDHELRGGTDASRYVTMARAIVVALYVATFLLLVGPTDMATTTYGVGPVILAILLLITGLVSLSVVGRRRRVSANPLAALAVMLAVPVVLLGLVAGTCVWSTTPIFFEDVR